jgi:hypothetical protein
MGSSIESIAHFDEQTLVAHPGQITARNPNIGQVPRSDDPLFKNESDCSLPQ